MHYSMKIKAKRQWHVSQKRWVSKKTNVKCLKRKWVKDILKWTTDLLYMLQSSAFSLLYMTLVCFYWETQIMRCTGNVVNTVFKVEQKNNASFILKVDNFCGCKLYSEK